MGSKVDQFGVAVEGESGAWDCDGFGWRSEFGMFERWGFYSGGVEAQSSHGCDVCKVMVVSDRGLCVVVEVVILPHVFLKPTMMFFGHHGPSGNGSFISGLDFSFSTPIKLLASLTRSRFYTVYLKLNCFSFGFVK